MSIAGCGASCLSSLTSRLSREVSRARSATKNEAVDLEWFLDEVVGALLDGRDRGFDIAVAGNHDHRQIGMLRLDAGKHLQAIEAAPRCSQMSRKIRLGRRTAIAAPRRRLSRAVRVV